MMDSFRPVNFTAGKKWALITAQPKCPRRRNESPGKKERCGGLWARRLRSGRLAWQRVGQTMGKSRTRKGEKTSCTKIREMLCISRPINQSRILTLAPIWLPHCPAWMWTISRMVSAVKEEALVGVPKSSLEEAAAAAEAVCSSRATRSNWNDGGGGDGRRVKEAGWRAGRGSRR